MPREYFWTLKRGLSLARPSKRAGEKRSPDDPGQVNLETIREKGKLGYKEIKPDTFSGGERVVLTLRMITE